MKGIMLVWRFQLFKHWSVPGHATALAEGLS